jgi:nucleotide-binding universal stress UspA family protein
MADHGSASIVTLHQPRPPRAKTQAERARAYRQRKRAAALPAVIPAPASTPVTLLPRAERPTLQADQLLVGAHKKSSRRHAAPILLTIAALALAVVGMTMNGWYARSLGSTETSGWLFLAIGVAADLVALVIPSCAASLWQARNRATALAGWGVWLVTFVFAITASIGFASVNISDTVTSRASRVTPAVTAA